MEEIAGVHHFNAYFCRNKLETKQKEKHNLRYGNR